MHGDVHLGNLLVAGDTAVWTDFEDACRGAAEIDIAGLPRALWLSFATADLDLIQICADLKSVCVAVWCAADPRTAAMREAATYHFAEVRRW